MNSYMYITVFMSVFILMTFDFSWAHSYLLLSKNINTTRIITKFLLLFQ